MKRVFISLFSIALVLGVFNNAQAQGGTGATTATTAVRFIPKAIKEESKKLRYTITARYPEATGASRNAALASLNQQLRELMEKEVAGFKKDFAPPDEVMSEMGSYYESE